MTILSLISDDLKKCTDHSSVSYYLSLRESLRLKKEEIERESRLLKLGKSDCPDVQEVAVLLSSPSRNK